MSFRSKAPQWGWLAAATLGWRPQEFWQATPAELSNALANPNASEGYAPPSRDLIEKLMERDAHG